jgi:hypothetical protein
MEYLKSDINNHPVFFDGLVKVILATLASLLLAVILITDVTLLLKLLLGAAFCIFIFLPNIQKIYLLVVTTICILAGARADMFFSVSIPGFRYVHILELMYGMIIAAFIVDLFRKKKHLQLCKEHIFLLLFYVMVFWSIFKGSEGALKNSLYTARELFYYAVCIVVMNEIVSTKQIKNVIKVMYVGVAIYSAELISIYIWSGNPLKMFLSQQGVWNSSRIAFGNHEIFLFSIPIAFVYLLSIKGIRNKAINFGILLCSVTFLILGQSRIALFCMVISMALMLILIAIKSRKLNVDLLKLYFILGLSTLAIISFFYFLNVYKTTPLISDIQTKITSFSKLSDDGSFRYRIRQWEREKDQIKEHLYFGQGMKSFYKDFNLGKLENIFWDNSNTLMIRKVGLVGYLFLLIFLASIVKKIIYCYSKSSNKMIIGFSAGLLSMIPGCILRLYTSPYLVQYKIILLYGIIFGVVEAMTKIVDEESMQKRINGRVI